MSAALADGGSGRFLDDCDEPSRRGVRRREGFAPSVSATPAGHTGAIQLGLQGNSSRPAEFHSFGLVPLDRHMLALALAATVTIADLQQWIEDQPAVAAYEQQRRAERLPREDAFRGSPTLPKAVACRGSSSAIMAAVTLFKAADGARLVLTEPALQARERGSACSPAQ